MSSTPVLIPCYFQTAPDVEFQNQVETLKALLGAEVQVASPLRVDASMTGADAVVFPQLSGDAYRQVDAIKRINLPLIALTSEFGTVSMWDWELVGYLASFGVKVLTPCSFASALNLCRALRVKKQLRKGKLLVFQDNPGDGQQASIFKRFYWWEKECSDDMHEKFGVAVVKRSFKELGEWAKQIPDSEAEKAGSRWAPHTLNVSPRALNSALKLYLALKDVIQDEGDVIATGINCLNESHFSDTTPCLAWNLLYEEQGMMWGCEADTMSMLTQYILNKSLNTPIMMTNLYPFLMGQAALKHERIENFPDVESPEDCVLVGHCGFLGVLPKSFSTEWTLKPKVLRIVNDNATAIDARLPVGKVTLAKLSPKLDRITAFEGTLERYVQYPGSDCNNGGVIRVRSGFSLLSKLLSHHYLLMPGHRLQEITEVAPVFGLAIESI